MDWRCCRTFHIRLHWPLATFGVIIITTLTELTVIDSLSLICPIIWTYFCEKIGIQSDTVLLTVEHAHVFVRGYERNTVKSKKN
jgi:hypothetical protein